MSSKLLSSCSYSAASSVYTGSQQYQKDLQTDLSVSTSNPLFGFSFSASTQFKKMKKSTMDEVSPLSILFFNPFAYS